MNFSPFLTLRRRPVRRAVAVLAMFALFLGGFAQAAHFHKSDAGGVETHLQCLLCLHVDRGSGPPVLPEISAPALIGGTAVVACVTSHFVDRVVNGYDARGPPTV